MGKVDRTVLLALFLGAVACNPSVAQARLADVNFQYPTDVLSVERAAEAGDGHVFVAKDGETRLLVGTLSNELHFSPAIYQDYIARNSYVDYRIEYLSAEPGLPCRGKETGRSFMRRSCLVARDGSSIASR